MTDIIKLAYEHGQMQALLDLGLEKDAGWRDILRHPIKSMKAGLGNREAQSFLANKVNLKAESALASAEAKAQAAKAFRQQTDAADLDAAIRAHMDSLNSTEIGKLSRGEAQLPKQFQDHYLRVHGKEMYPAPAANTNPNPNPNPNKNKKSNKDFTGWMKNNPVPTALGGAALGAGALYGINEYNREPSLLERIGL
jgi:hypothetical protein